MVQVNRCQYTAWSTGSFLTFFPCVHFKLPTLTSYQSDFFLNIVMTEHNLWSSDATRGYGEHIQYNDGYNSYVYFFLMQQYTV